MISTACGSFRCRVRRDDVPCMARLVQLLGELLYDFMMMLPARELAAFEPALMRASPALSDFYFD